MQNNSKTHELVLTALFAAIIVAMSFTPLGYIPLVAINATTLHIPVILGSIFLGPKRGAFLGGVFGVTSLLKSTFVGGSLSAFVFSPVQALTMLPHDTAGQAVAIALKSTFIPVVPRIVIGIVPFFVFVGIKKMLTSKMKIVWGTLVNAIISFITGFGVYALFNGMVKQAKLGVGVFFRFINEGDAITEGYTATAVVNDQEKLINVLQAGIIFPIALGAVLGVAAFIAIEILFMKKDAKALAFTTAGIAGAMTNTILVMGSIYVFYRIPYSEVMGVKPSQLMAAIGAIISFNGVIEAVVGAIIVYLVGIVLDKIKPAGVVAKKAPKAKVVTE